jgi:hypothetical protein
MHKKTPSPYPRPAPRVPLPSQVQQRPSRPNIPRTRGRTPGTRRQHLSHLIAEPVRERVTPGPLPAKGR